MKVKSLSRVRLLATPWTAAYQAPPSMGFSRQEFWSGVPLPSPLGTPEGAKCLFFREVSHLMKRRITVLNWSRVKVTRSCPTHWDPMDYTVHGILQVRIPEWVAYPFSSRPSRPSNQTGFPALQVDSLPTELSGKPLQTCVSLG